MRFSRVKVSFDIVPSGIFWKPKWPCRSTMVDLHGHFGFQNIPAGTMSKETFTRENLIDHMQRLAFHGVGAAVGVGDLVDRSDMHGGRTGWGDVPLKLREEVVPGAALFRTSGAGMAWPGSGAQGDP